MALCLGLVATLPHCAQVMSTGPERRSQGTPALRRRFQIAIRDTPASSAMLDIGSPVAYLRASSSSAIRHIPIRDMVTPRVLYVNLAYSCRALPSSLPVTRQPSMSHAARRTQSGQPEADSLGQQRAGRRGRWARPSLAQPTRVCVRGPFVCAGGAVVPLCCVPWGGMSGWCVERRRMAVWFTGQRDS
jgi:hypothetical protein